MKLKLTIVAGVLALSSFGTLADGQQSCSDYSGHYLALRATTDEGQTVLRPGDFSPTEYVISQDGCESVSIDAHQLATDFSRSRRWLDNITYSGPIDNQFHEKDNGGSMRIRFDGQVLVIDDSDSSVGAADPEITVQIRLYRVDATRLSIVEPVGHSLADLGRRIQLRDYTEASQAIVRNLQSPR